MTDLNDTSLGHPYILTLDDNQPLDGKTVVLTGLTDDELERIQSGIEGALRPYEPTLATKIGGVSLVIALSMITIASAVWVVAKLLSSAFPNF